MTNSTGNNASTNASITVPSIPLVTVFVRHSADCSHKDDSFYKRCQCRKSLRFFHNGKQRTQSAKTRSFALAEEAKRKLEDQFRAADPSKPIETVTVTAESRPTIAKAVELFISDKRSQGLDANFIAKYERELGRFTEFMNSRGRFFPHEMTVEDFNVMRTGWNDLYPSSTTRSKVQERLRSFLRYLFNSRIIDRIPRLTPIKITAPPTMPLSDAEYTKLLKAIPEEYSKEYQARKATRVHAIIQLMRWSGLAMHDAVTLERTELAKDRGRELYRIVTSRQKTGVHVSVPIPTNVAKEMIAAMELNDNAKYGFWSGNGKVKTALTNRGNDLRRVFHRAGFTDGHPHQLRDTFAVSLLEKGVPLEEVSKLLGHESIKTTEKHYAKWVKARQDRLDALVTATFDKA
ncbi:MAG TPA: tyrosine-type recombinase/integrase [Edaphobacter sp.]|jgi:site-specific recombinase XerD|nr:tyrosine-type recombinase/integrase [Edaphobacter sp.]